MALACVGNYTRRLSDAHSPAYGTDTGTDKVMGLDAGADDYVVKPLIFRELTAPALSAEAIPAYLRC